MDEVYKVISLFAIKDKRENKCLRGLRQFYQIVIPQVGFASRILLLPFPVPISLDRELRLQNYLKLQKTKLDSPGTTQQQHD